MKRIVLSHEFIDELEDLFDILVERGFFSYDEYAQRYIDDIEHFIASSIHAYPNLNYSWIFSIYTNDHELPRIHHE